MGAQVGILSNNQWPAPFDGSMYSGSGRNLKTWWNFEDFLEGNYQISGPWYGGLTGAGAALSQVVATDLRAGILSLITGTTAAGRATMYSLGPNSDGIRFGAGQYTIEGDVFIPTLSTVAEEYTIQFGFGDTSGADFVDGAYFRYDRLGAGTNWRLKTASNSARTDTDSTIAVTAGAWTRLKVVVNPTGTSVAYYINEALVGTLTTNIPTGAGRETGALFQILKSAGLTSRAFNLDWVWLHIDLTASR